MSEFHRSQATALPGGAPEAATSPPLAVVTAPPRDDGRHDLGTAPREERSLPRGRTWILIVADMVAIAAALAITYAVAEAAASPSIIAPTWLVLLLAAVVLPVWMAIFTAYNLYERQNRSISIATFDEVGELFHALIAGSLFFLILSQVLRRVMGAEVFFPVEAAMFLATALPLVLLTRGSVRSWLLPAIMHPRRTLIVGTGEVARMVERKISAHPEYRLELVGFVDDEAHGDGVRAARGAAGRPPTAGGRTRDRLGHPRLLTLVVRGDARPLAGSASARRAPLDRAALLRGVRLERHHPGARGNAGGEPAADAPVARCAPDQARRGRGGGGPGAGAAVAAARTRRGGHQARQPRAGVLPAGAPRSRRLDLQDREVPHHARGGGGRARRHWRRSTRSRARSSR